VLCAGLLAGTAAARAQDVFGRGEDVLPRELEPMYRRGLAYLVKTQTELGCWEAHYGKQPGVVGLAVLAMLAHGDEPNTGPYARPIRKGLSYIVGSANKGTGFIGDSMYNHGFATLALAEAYGMVEMPTLQPTLERAIGLILASQAQNKAGAWRYKPDSKDADSTVSGAILVALFAARNAGFGVPEAAVTKALDFYRRVQNSDGGFGYVNRSRSNMPRTAIGTLMFALAKKRDEPECRSGLRYLQARIMNAQQGYYYYYLYYVSQSLFQADPETWVKWNTFNMVQLKQSQNADGSWTGQHGPAFSTAAALLSLAVNYRFLPIYER